MFRIKDTIAEELMDLNVKIESNHDMYEQAFVMRDPELKRIMLDKCMRTDIEIAQRSKLLELRLLAKEDNNKGFMMSFVAKLKSQGKI